LVRGDHEISEKKLKAALGTDNLQLASEAIVEEITRAPKGFAGPVGISVPMIADHDVRNMVNFITGANEKDAHLIQVNVGRDFQVSQFADLRRFVQGDPCSRCGGETRTDKGIEVGHTFKLGTKYSRAMNARFTDEQGNEREFVMGCYGIGVGRTVAAAIEQSYDQDGIIFPMPIAPFQVLLLPVNIKSELLQKKAEDLYSMLLKEGVEVLYDDREETPGVKFKDADLIGVPWRIVVGKKLGSGMVELVERKTRKATDVPVQEAAAAVKQRA
jgi:prolyl-tRNA synthetase